MILGAGVKAYVCAAPIDMRKSIDGLAQLVAPVFGADPFNGRVCFCLLLRCNEFSHTSHPNLSLSLRI